MLKRKVNGLGKRHAQSLQPLVRIYRLGDLSRLELKRAATSPLFQLQEGQARIGLVLLRVAENPLPGLIQGIAMLRYRLASGKPLPQIYPPVILTLDRNLAYGDTLRQVCYRRPLLLRTGLPGAIPSD